MNPASTSRSMPWSSSQLPMRRVARVAVGMVGLVEHGRLDTRGRGPLQATGVRPAGADADDLDPRVQQRLQVGALPRHQDADRRI